MRKISFILNEILYILLVFPVLFLLVNKFPYLLIFSVVISVFIGILFFVSKRSITSFHTEILGILLIIYIYIIISYFFSGQNLVNFFSYPFLRNDGNFFFCYILFFVFAIPFLDYKKLAKLYFIFIFSVFTIFSLLGIIEYFLGKWSIMVWEDVYAGRIFFALNFAHNATGSVYAIVCIFALVFFLKEKINNLKVLYFFILFINLVALFITKSRGSYLGFILGAIFVLWLHYKSVKKFFKALGIMALISLPLIFITGIYKRIFQIFDLKGAPTVIRFELWDRAWYLFSQSPLFGIGFGRFNDIFSIDRHVFNIERLKGYPGIFTYYANQSFYFDSAHIHNSYLQFLTETGIIGIGLLMLFWTLCLVKILKAYLDLENEFTNKVYLSSAGSIITLLALSLSENYLSATTIMIPLSMLTSLAIGLSWQERYRYYSISNLNILEKNNF